MTLTSKSIVLQVPSKIIYNALKNIKLEEIFPEFFVGISKRIVNNNINEEITFKTVISYNQIVIYENFKLKIYGKYKTQILYNTKTNTDEGNIMIESIIQTHIANVLYAFLMLELGYIHGQTENGNKKKSSSGIVK
jgi:hypothetical protein